MAVMSFRESNQVRWRGIRPGHNGTQVLESAPGVNGTVVLYTVAAGATLYLVSVFLGLLGSAAATHGQIWIRDAVPANLYLLASVYSAANDYSASVPHTYWPPIEIPATYSLALVDVAANMSQATIFGWVE